MVLPNSGQEDLSHHLLEGEGILGKLLFVFFPALDADMMSEATRTSQQDDENPHSKKAAQSDKRLGGRRRHHCTAVPPQVPP